VYFTALMSEWQSVLVRTLVCVSVYIYIYTNQQNMLLQVRVDKNLTAVRLRLMEEQDSLVGAHEQVCALHLCKWMVEPASLI